MARKKKVRVFRASQAVKAAAREQIGSPQPTRIVPDRRKNAEEKHKPKLQDLVERD
jgi:hypothetical protein